MLLILASLRILECVRGGEEEEERVKEKTEVGGTLWEKRAKNKKRGGGGAGGASEGSEELKLPSRAAHVGYVMTPERVLRGGFVLLFSRMLVNHHHDHHRQGPAKAACYFKCVLFGMRGCAFYRISTSDKTHCFSKKGSRAVNGGRKWMVDRNNVSVISVVLITERYSSREQKYCVYT